MKITLTGTPATTNTLYRSHCKFGHPVVYMTAKGKDLKEQYYYEIKNQWKEEMRTTAKIDITFYFGNKRKNDIDNFTKLILDSLENIVIVDDSRITDLNLHKRLDVKNPRIEINVI